MSRPESRTLRSLSLTIGWLAISCPALAVEPPGWDVDASARYLDGRAKEWESFHGADRGRGADKVSCLSCHTSVPYTLGRAALRHVVGDEKPTPHEARILEQVRGRVAHWDELDTPRFRLSYDFDERKKAESWGTEAILNALVLASDDRRRGREAPGDATRQALRNLWSAQVKEGDEAGSWDWLDFGLRPWEASEARYYGASLAAIAVGTAPGYLRKGLDADASAGIDRLRNYLASHLDQNNLHNRLFVLWASTSLDGLLTPGQRREIAETVRGKQQPDGGWSLSSLVDCRRQDGTPQETAPDGYATGLSLHVLQVAGMRRDEPAVARGLAWLRAHQQPSGNWIGVSLNKRRDPKTHAGKFMSDAATAFAILALEER